ncbi:type II secretion system protein GspG, partial [Patescibacteria group bacterium]|nr:type II secretion system protein GspG [Patescibacteria group bacterium]
LVVVAIMGMLAALAVVALNNARARARDARRVSDVKQIQTALELYYLDNNDYPATPASSIVTDLCLSATNDFNATCSGTVYMAQVPENPKPYDDHAECTAAYADYLYTRNDSNSYHLSYCVGADIGQIGAGLHTATPGGIVED